MGRRRSIGTGARTGARTSSSLLHAVPAAALAVALAACQDAAPPMAPLGAAHAPRLAAAPDAMPNAASDLLPDEYIVTFRNDVQDAPGLAKQLATQHGTTVRFTYTAAIKGFAAHMSAQAAAALRNNAQIAYIESDRAMRLASVQTAVPSWGIDRVDQRARPLDGAFGYATDGAGVNVYIVDSGIRSTHVEFEGRAVGVYTTISDGNGTFDCTGHGTHVAGIIGGRTFGVAKKASLYALRVYDCSGTASMSAVISAVDWVTKNRVLPAVANMSLAGTTSSTLNLAVQSSINAGVTYAVAAANYSADACGYSPANLPAAITVGATNSTDGQAAYSNYGSCVDVYAPGSSILSAWYTSDTATFYSSGTSMATPHVAGAAALYLATHRAATPAQVAQALVANATPNVITSLGAGSPNLLLYTGFVGAASASDTAAAQPAPSSPTTGTTTTPAPTPSATPPTAQFTATCPRSTCTFDASGSTSGSGIARFAWTFGDRTSSFAATAKIGHSYSSVGNFTVTLTVTDGTGSTASTSQTVRIKKL